MMTTDSVLSAIYGRLIIAVLHDPRFTSSPAPVTAPLSASSLYRRPLVPSAPLGVQLRLCRPDSTAESCVRGGTTACQTAHGMIQSAEGNETGRSCCFGSDDLMNSCVTPSVRHPIRARTGRSTTPDCPRRWHGPRRPRMASFEPAPGYLFASSASRSADICIQCLWRPACACF